MTRRIPGEPRLHWLDPRAPQPPRLAPFKFEFISSLDKRPRSAEFLHENAMKKMSRIDSLPLHKRALVWIYGSKPSRKLAFNAYALAKAYPTKLAVCNAPEVLDLARPVGTFSIDDL